MEITVDEFLQKNINNYKIFENDDGTILLKPKIIRVQVNDYNILSNYIFTNSIIKSASIIEDDEIENITKLKYNSILESIYSKINDGTSIIKKTFLNIKTTLIKDKGFNYYPDLGISVQRVDANKCIKEIFNQAIHANININITAKLEDGSTYNFYN